MAGITHTELRLLLDAPLREHATVGIEVLKAALLKTPDREALQDALEENNAAVAEAIEAGYPGTHDDFLELWRAHSGYYRESLDATIQDDEAAKEKAKDKLEAFTEEASNILADASPLLDPDDLQEALNIHICHITAIITDLADEEYDDAYATAHETYEHMGLAAELLSRYASIHQTGTIRL